ncbi:MAG: hypothetical protein E7513_00115 [Ruminococcaceae bacterium]|nr:hypothetical protein [Oscillospiraceae bacterium]
MCESNRRMLIKVVSILFTIISICALLFGCKTDEDTKPTNPHPTTPKHTTVPTEEPTLPDYFDFTSKESLDIIDQYENFLNSWEFMDSISSVDVDSTYEYAFLDSNQDGKPEMILSAKSKKAYKEYFFDYDSSDDEVVLLDGFDVCDKTKLNTKNNGFFVSSKNKDEYRYTLYYIKEDSLKPEIQYGEQNGQYFIAEFGENDDTVDYDDFTSCSADNFKSFSDSNLELDWKELDIKSEISSTSTPYSSILKKCQYPEGNLFDIDGNGIKELIFISNSTANIYTMANGQAVAILENEELTQPYGAPHIRIYVINEYGRNYLVLHAENGETGEGAVRHGFWNTYNVNGSSCYIENSIEYEYKYNNDDTRTTNYINSTYGHSSYEEMKRWEENLDVLLKIDTMNNDDDGLSEGELLKKVLE